MLNKKFIYIIYDIEDFSVWNVFDNEGECISVFEKYFQGFVNVNWIAINLSCVLEFTLKNHQKIHIGDIPTHKEALFNEYYSIYGGDTDLPF